MADTIAIAIESVMNQIDDRFEVIVIDDGSSDSSLEIIQSLSLKYKNLFAYGMKRDKGRRLGETRNYSIKLARGEWCLFHIDMDDHIGPHLLDFIRTVELIDSYLPGERLYSGKQIHMARKSFLVGIGPFKNIYRGEDRDLYERLAPFDKWLIIDHVRFVTRMKRSQRKLFKKKVFDVWDQTITDLQFCRSPIAYLLISARKIQELRPRRFFLRAFLIPVAFLIACKRGFFKDDEKLTLKEFISYRQMKTKTLSSWMELLKIEKCARKEIDNQIFP